VNDWKKAPILPMQARVEVEMLQPIPPPSLGGAKYLLFYSQGFHRQCLGHTRLQWGCPFIGLILLFLFNGDFVVIILFPFGRSSASLLPQLLNNLAMIPKLRILLFFPKVALTTQPLVRYCTGNNQRYLQIWSRWVGSPLQFI